MSAGTLRRRFATLECGELDALVGTHEAMLPGPAPVRALSATAIALGGMPRWYGKRFWATGDDRLCGVNLLRPRHAGPLVSSLPMTAAIAPSWLDGPPALVVSYGASARVPWRWVRDEFRPLADGALLGLTFAVTPRSRALAAPFTLLRR